MTPQHISDQIKINIDELERTLEKATALTKWTIELQKKLDSPK
jgi:hypothetical protein